MYFVEFHATPAPGHPEAQTVGGAYVNCWIEATDLDSAVHRARTEIIGSGWCVGELRRAYETSRDEYSGEDDGLEYYEQALIDEEVYVFHTYPIHDEPE